MSTANNTQALAVGTVIVDNDPRMMFRSLRILDLDVRYAYARMEVRGRPPGRIVRIQRNRIFTDAKPRRTGFSLRPNNGAQQ